MFVRFQLPLLSLGAVDDLGKVVLGGVLRYTTLTKADALV